MEGHRRTILIYHWSCWSRMARATPPQKVPKNLRVIPVPRSNRARNGTHMACAAWRDRTGDDKMSSLLWYSSNTNINMVCQAWVWRYVWALTCQLSATNLLQVNRVSGCKLSYTCIYIYICIIYIYNMSDGQYHLFTAMDTSKTGSSPIGCEYVRF